MCLYAPINVISDYHRYGLRVEEGWGCMVGEWTTKFPRGGGDVLLPKKHTFQSCGSPTPIPGFVIGRFVGECTTIASPVGGEL